MTVLHGKRLRVIIVSSDPALREQQLQVLADAMMNNTPVEDIPLPQEDFETFTARGRVADCNCNLIQCVCVEARAHKPECPYRFALTCAVPIACDQHGVDACPACDACTCATETK